MFDILHYTFLRLGDAHRFGPPHLRQIVRKMPAHYIAEAKREKLGMSGIEKIVTFDQGQSRDGFVPGLEANNVRTRGANEVVAFPGNIRKSITISMLRVSLWCARRDSNPHDFTHCHLKAARLPIPPRALVWIGPGVMPDRINGAGCNKSGVQGQGLPKSL
jgi:hypothetical protein